MYTQAPEEKPLFFKKNISAFYYTCQKQTPVIFLTEPGEIMHLNLKKALSSKDIAF